MQILFDISTLTYTIWAMQYIRRRNKMLKTTTTYMPLFLWFTVGIGAPLYGQQHGASRLKI